LDKWSNPHTLPAPFVDLTFVNATPVTVRDIGVVQEQALDEAVLRRGDSGNALGRSLSTGSGALSHPQSAAGQGEEDEAFARGDDASAHVRQPPASPPDANAVVAPSSPVTPDARLRRTASHLDEQSDGAGENETSGVGDGEGTERHLVLHDVDLPEDTTNLWVIGRYVVPW
jgi:hypothetical protein